MDAISQRALKRAPNLDSPFLFSGLKKLPPRPSGNKYTRGRTGAAPLDSQSKPE